MSIDTVFQSLWKDYVQLNPTASQIHDLIVSKGEKVVNDHVAFRTFRHPRTGVSKLAQVFVNEGYEFAGEYEFKEKKLYAQHFEHSDPDQPKVFISELLVEQFSSELQENVSKMIGEIPEGREDKSDFIYSGRLWKVSHKIYLDLMKESEYAAWLSAFGFRANHFTVLVNRLNFFKELAELNSFLEENGHTLNSSGGKIKGSPEVLLEQSSTMAKEIVVDFSDGAFEIPACYYEFAKRYSDTNGKLYQGFVAQSADKIFESTNKS